MKPKKSNSTIEISSLIDLIFILLLFFIVTTTFKKSTLELNLPKSNVNTVTSQEKTVDIYINKQGQCFINNTPYTLESIGQYLSKKTNKSVIIFPDKDTKTQYLILVMETLKQANIETVSIATEKK